ncbi:MAG: non-canonical purine NTP pyrophosphatase [Bulleidia sp.]
MKVLLGTTNPSKVRRFADLLKDCDVGFLTLQDIGVSDEPEENGTTPEENAVAKAVFYGRYSDIVICHDSGLYFEELPIDDVRQPGLHVRTPSGMTRLSDEEMILYYSSLIHDLGGKVTAYYLDGMAVYNHGVVYSFMDPVSARTTGSFQMVDRPSPIRLEGWPLDSLSINRDTGQYFVSGRLEETKENIIRDEYKRRIVRFLKDALKTEDVPYR